MWKSRSFATPNCQFFEVHGSEFKPHPACNPGQTSVVCITHPVLFFRVRKGTLNRLLAPCVNILPHLCFSNLFYQIQIFLPDVSLQDFLPLRICSALLTTGTTSAFFRRASVYSFSFFGCCGVTKRLSLRAGKRICSWIINVIPGTVSVFFASSACVRKNGDPVVIQNLLCNPRRFICGIHGDVFYF